MKSPKYTKRLALMLACMAISLTVYGCGQTPSDTTTTTQTANTTTQNTTANSNTVSSQETTYNSPWGQDSILVSLVLDTDKKITDVNVKYNASNHESQEYMNKFDKWIKSAVVGKTIAEAKVSNINWASLTSAAFNNALDTIQS